MTSNQKSKAKTGLHYSTPMRSSSSMCRQRSSAHQTEAQAPDDELHGMRMLLMFLLLLLLLQAPARNLLQEVGGKSGWTPSGQPVPMPIAAAASNAAAATCSVR
uniref:Uncharacterized protein n=1 Tax=Macrostomum lignano TaxID=282301 RepID=A0A1I8JIJ2_9PLAT